MIVTADERLREEAVIYRDQGKAGFLGGEHIRLGYAWRMSEVHAAIASVHLRRLDEFIATRASVRQAIRRCAARAGPDHARYSFPTRPFPTTTSTSPCSTGIPTAPRQSRAARAGRVAERRGLCDAAAPRTGIRPAGTRPLPVAEDVCARQICLPIHSDMTDAEVDYVLESLAQVLRRGAAP